MIAPFYYSSPFNYPRINNPMTNNFINFLNNYINMNRMNNMMGMGMGINNNNNMNNINGLNNMMGMGADINNSNNANNLNGMNNDMNLFNQFFMINNMNLFNQFFMNNNMNFFENQKIERKEGLDIKCDIDRLLYSNSELENKNKDLQTIINFIPSTIIKDTPKKLTDEYRCVICLSDFEIEEKVSALPCCHTFHTNCLDNWLKQKRECPVCKYEVTLKSILGEDILQEYLEIQKKKKLKEKKKKS